MQVADDLNEIAKEEDWSQSALYKTESATFICRTFQDYNLTKCKCLPFICKK